MATRAQIDRLAQRIEALAPAPRFEGKVAIIIVDGESEDAARERHNLAHPEDCGASHVVFMHVVDPKPANGFPLALGGR